MTQWVTTSGLACDYMDRVRMGMAGVLSLGFDLHIRFRIGLHFYDTSANVFHTVCSIYPMIPRIVCVPLPRLE